MARHTALIRPARETDFKAIAAIYRPFVTDTAITFETNPPDADEMRQRWRKCTTASAPYLVAEHAGKVVAYAYAQAFSQRAAYRWTVENSIYVSPAVQRQGVGRSLLGALISAAEQAGFRQMVALIAAGQVRGSVELHRALGFAEVGLLKSVGYKHGRWHDVIYMQRALGAGATSPPQQI